MFNPEIKERFLNENANAKFILSMCARYEESIGKDISQMNKHDVGLVLQSADLCELSTIEGMLSVGSAYTKWCKDNNLLPDISDGFMSIDVKDVDPSAVMAKMLFRDEEDFIRSMRKVREFDEGYPEVIGLVFVWLGLSYNDATTLKDSCVDLDTRVIYDNDGNVLVSGFSDGIHSIFEQFVKCMNGNRGAYNVVKDRSLDVFLKRMCSPSSPKMGTPILPRQLTNAVNRMNFQYEELGYPPRLSMLNVKRSGSLYRLWLAEQNGLDVSNKNNREAVERVYGGKKYRNIIWQYKYYKKAFNL